MTPPLRGLCRVPMPGGRERPAIIEMPFYHLQRPDGLRRISAGQGETDIPLPNATCSESNRSSIASRPNARCCCNSRSVPSASGWRGYTISTSSRIPVLLYEMFAGASAGPNGGTGRLRCSMRWASLTGDAAAERPQHRLSLRRGRAGCGRRRRAGAVGARSCAGRSRSQFDRGQQFGPPMAGTLIPTGPIPTDITDQERAR